MKADWNKERLTKLCSESSSIYEVLRAMGLNASGGGNSETLRRKAREFGIDISHFSGKRWKSNPKHSESWKKCREHGFGTPTFTIDEILVENSPITKSGFRKRLRSSNIIQYKCDLCGNEGQWLGKEISLELDHINGINNDNRIENLRWLCPNCHALTSTYCGRNIRKD